MVYLDLGLDINSDGRVVDRLLFKGLGSPVGFLSDRRGGGDGGRDGRGLVIVAKDGFSLFNFNPGFFDRIVSIKSPFSSFLSMYSSSYLVLFQR